MSMKVAIFQGKEPQELQSDINVWLSNNPDIHVDHVTQSQVQHGQSGPMPITVCIWYTEPQYK